jgi:hypothetical protein
MNTTAKSSTETQNNFTRAKALAKKLGIHHLTLARWADEGRVSRYKVNDRVVLYDEGEVFDMIRSTKVKPVQSPSKRLGVRSGDIESAQPVTSQPRPSQLEQEGGLH